MTETPGSSIEKEVREIRARNSRVEADKAWETSLVRIVAICMLTYLIAAWVLATIGAVNYWQSALIPTLGFYLSTQSLPFIKRWWVKRYFKERREIQ